MNLRFKLSLTANVLLGLLLLWPIHSRNPGREPVRPAQGDQQGPGAPAAPPPGPATAALVAAPAAFRWSQLESSDYRGYIQNLRAAGCPENVIRAIVTVDADGAFAFQRRQLNLGPEAGGPWSRQSEERLIASLLGEREATAAGMPVTAPEPGPAPRPAPRSFVVRPPDPTMPLVFRVGDPGQLPLTDAQKDIVVRLRQEFLEEIGGPNQDPNDPAYLARWQAAQPKIDQAVRGRLGFPVLLQLRLLVSQNLGVPPSQP